MKSRPSKERKWQITLASQRTGGDQAASTESAAHFVVRDSRGRIGTHRDVWTLPVTPL